MATMIREDMPRSRTRDRQALINIDPAVIYALRDLLFEPEFHAVGYSEFLERAIEVARSEIEAARVG